MVTISSLYLLQYEVFVIIGQGKEKGGLEFGESSFIRCLTMTPHLLYAIWSYLVNLPHQIRISVGQLMPSSLL